MYGNLSGFPLNELGVQQAEEAGRWLGQYSLSRVIASPRERTRETAEIIARLNPGQPEIIIDERLRDIDLGTLTGEISMEEFHRRRQAYWQRQAIGDDGMEAPMITQARMLEIFLEFTRQFPTDNLLFVSHADPMAFLFQGLTDQPLQPSAASEWQASDRRIGKANIFEITLSPQVIIKKVFSPTIQ